MSSSPHPLFESYRRVLELNFQQLTEEQPTMQLAAPSPAFNGRLSSGWQ